MAEIRALTQVRAGMEILFGGDRVAVVSAELAEAFRPGDALYVVDGELLHVPAASKRVAGDAVGRAYDAFRRMGGVRTEQISEFYREFAARLEADEIWRRVQSINDEDVADAKRRGRSATRLVADEKLRRGMIDGLRGWINAGSRRGELIESIAHEGWRVDLVGAELGVIGFVFEGRPNVLADATGVLRGGNTVVFRIGRDALRTARALMELALTPSLAAAGLPEGAASLVDSSEHAAGWAMFSDPRLALAVARGSGTAVATLGGLARQAGVPVSLHGTGGAWVVAGQTASAERFESVVRSSLDRKVCNTLNVCCVVRERAGELIPHLLRAAEDAGAQRGQGFKLHVVAGSEAYVPEGLFARGIKVRRAEGDVEERQAEILDEADLAREWEWEETPELSVRVVETVDEAIALFNRYSPQFVASLISEDESEQQRFFEGTNAPFVGDGFTRWVDGQYALKRPELGLSNWQNGRLLARGGVLSGDSVYTVRARVRQQDPSIKR